MYDIKPDLYDDKPDLYDDMTDLYDDMTDLYAYPWHVWYQVIGGDCHLHRFHPSPKDNRYQPIVVYGASNYFSTPFLRG